MLQGLINVQSISAAALVVVGTLYYKRKTILLSSLKFINELKSKQTTHVKGLNMMKVPVGKSFIVIPFNESKEFDMILYSVYGTDRNGVNHNITQMAGVPYNFSPNELGFESITVTNEATLESKVFEDDEMIGYADGV